MGGRVEEIVREGLYSEVWDIEHNDMKVMEGRLTNIYKISRKGSGLSIGHRSVDRVLAVIL